MAYNTMMTFQQLADKLGIHILDLIPDAEQATELQNEQLFVCQLTDSLQEEGILDNNLQFI